MRDKVFKLMKIFLLIILIILAAMSVMYGIFVKSVGSGTKFYLVWFAFAVMCTILSVLIKFDILSKIPLPVRISMLLIAVVSAVFTGMLVVKIAIYSYNASHYDYLKRNMDYIIVLGAQVRENGPSAVLEQRLIAAVEYLNENKNTECIVSGGKGVNEPKPEAVVMKEYLIEHGISSDRILIEDKSQNTIQNIRNSIGLIDIKNDTVGIVTSDFHVYRGVMIAKKQGIENVYGIAAKSNAVYYPNNVLRECVGVIKDTIMGNM